MPASRKHQPKVGYKVAIKVATKVASNVATKVTDDGSWAPIARKV